MNADDKVLEHLKSLGLNYHEARIYIELLKNPSSPWRLSQATDINRTRIYRIVANLEKRGLIARRADDRGTFLVATDPSTLEVELANQEARLLQQRDSLKGLVVELGKLQQREDSEFIVHTYEGVAGMKQMLWHELKAKGEILVFGNGTLEELVGSHNWCEKHRARYVETGIKTRIIHNLKSLKHFTSNDEYMTLYTKRTNAMASLLCLNSQVVIYNDTVATYYWRREKKVGVEIINKGQAEMMRQIFEHYWQLANT